MEPALRRSKMRSFNWDTIPHQRVLGRRNVWTAQAVLQDIQLDTKGMEELFSHRDRAPPRKAIALKKSVHGVSPTGPGVEKVSILNSKKSMNIGIFLKQFRRPVKDLVEDIKQGKGQSFGTGKLKELRKLLPEDGEVTKLRSFEGDLATLTEADQFMVTLVKVSGYEERLNSLILMEEFFPLMDELKQSISVMVTAANELLDCDDLHSIIRLVLKAGNYMNSGGYAGSAIGFRMTSLLRVVDTKANKPGMNLMHYVAMQAQKIDVSLLQFPRQLQHIAAASRILKQEVESDFHREALRIRAAKQEASMQADLHTQMEGFLSMAELHLNEVETVIRELLCISYAVAEFFCEDPATFKLEECCSIFHSFCQKFEKAVLENEEREAAEVRQRRRRLNSAKRRSTATCSDREKNHDEGDSLESVLHCFMSGRSSRRKPGPAHPAAAAGPPETRPRQAGLDTMDEDGVGDSEGRLDPSRSPGDMAEAAVKDEQRMRAGSRRGQNIHDTLTPTCSNRSHALTLTNQHTPLGEGEEPRDQQKGGTEEVDKRVEQEEEGKRDEDDEVGTSRKVLRYHNSRGDLLADAAAPDTLRVPQGLSTPQPLPRHREIREVDLALQNGHGGLGSPWTILSPRVSPRETPCRRRSFSLSRADSLDDGVWALPDTPPSSRRSPAARLRAAEHCQSPLVLRGSSCLPEGPSRRTPSQGPGQRCRSLTESSEPALSRLGGLFHRRFSQDGPPAKRQDSLFLASFFRRLGDWSRPGRVGIR
uniref:FH2 domain-containing protein n=1 Tax=Denticeps clupeoides TaxID=299321 RepID=A0AAY4ELY5_9TELE